MRGRRALRKFLWLMFLELVQNVPLVVGFILAFRFWQKEMWVPAVVSMIAGGIVAALVIWVTEPMIFEGHRETLHQVIGNSLTFPVLTIVMILYLSARWTRWWTDIVGGLIIALALAVAQEWAAKERFGFVRSLWLGLSCSMSLIFIRLLLPISALLTIVVVSVWFTLVMGLYKHWRLQAAVPAE